MPAIDRDAPLRFLRTAFEPDDWAAIFLKSYESGRVAQRVGPVHGLTHPHFQAWLRARNAERFNVYVSVNAIKQGWRSRTRDAVGAIRHVFLEADEDGAGVLARVAARTDLPEPSYVLHSSPGKVHVFWRVAGFDLEQVEALQKQLARELGTDAAATPPTQATRLPGFLNHKYQPPHLIDVEYRLPERRFAEADFPTPEAQTMTSAAAVRRSAPGFNPVRWPDAVAQARRYLAHVPPAVAGQHGDVHTFRVCCRLVRGFGLDDDQAMELLIAWNAACEPPWTHQGLRDKIRRAKTYGREPFEGRLAVTHLQRPTRG